MMRAGRRRRRSHISRVVFILAALTIGIALIGYFVRFSSGSKPQPEEAAALQPEELAKLQPEEMIELQPEAMAKPQPEEAAALKPDMPSDLPAQAEPETVAEPTQSLAREPISASVMFSEHAQNILSEMTLREKVCQMMFATPAAITGVQKAVNAGDVTRKALEKYPVGGLYYDKSNIEGREQLRNMLANSQSYSKIPLILTCDEEGGRVNRLMSTVGTTPMKAMLEYKDEGPQKARENAMTIAKDMLEFGFNMDLAPVADVWSNPQNTVIGDRAYSDDFQQAAQLIPAAVAGFQEGGIACTLKHFPGHGDTVADSHYGAAYVYKTLDELRTQELLPFQAGIDAGADSVMLGHVTVESVSKEPAVFSYELVTELLREEMGFGGVVMTDALAMKAVSEQYSNDDVVLKAVKAGVDMLLCPQDLDGAIQAIIQAVENGDIPESRIDESVLRIINLKEKRGFFER